MRYLITMVLLVVSTLPAVAQYGNWGRYNSWSTPMYGTGYSYPQGTVNNVTLGNPLYGIPNTYGTTTYDGNGGYSTMQLGNPYYGIPNTYSSGTISY